MIATTSHAIRRPRATTIMIQGTNNSLNLNSGRFSASAKKLTRFDFSTINIVRLSPEVWRCVLLSATLLANCISDQTPIYDSEECFSPTTWVPSQSLRSDQKEPPVLGIAADD